MTLCLLDTLSCGRCDVDRTASNFVKWMFTGKFSINRFTFDIGTTTKKAIVNMALGTIRSNAV